MLDIIRTRIRKDLSREENINQVREFLQIIILKILYDMGAFRNLAFVGGTALRIFYDLRRYSEDLDFSLIHKRGYSTLYLYKEIERELIKNYGLMASIKTDTERTVHSIDIKYEGLLFELGLSTHKAQRVYIRLGIDTNTPPGWRTELSLVSEGFVFTVLRFDLPSLYATKLHACFFRPYTKGRDIYDLIWYLGKGLLPNFTLLNNAIEQTEGKNPGLEKDNFKEFLLSRIERIEFAKAKKDVERFLVNKDELRLFNRELLMDVVNSKAFI
jgi:hypothetical protein